MPALTKTSFLATGAFAAALLFFAGSAAALPQTDAEKREFLESIANPLEEDRVFYRWQTKRSGDALVNAGELTDNLHRYFMSMEHNWDYLKAGRGVYIAEDIYSASEFARGGDEGSLIRVELEKGMKILDLSDSEVIKALQENGISTRDVYILDPPLAVKYDGRENWWVVKAQKGVRFRTFDGSEMPLKQMLDRFSDLAHRRAKRIFSSAVRERLLTEVERDFRVLRNPSFRNVLGKDAVADAMERAALAVATSAELAELRQVIEGSQLLRETRSQIPGLHQTLLQAEARVTSVEELLSRFQSASPFEASSLMKLKLTQISDPGQFAKTLTDLSDLAPDHPEIRFMLQNEQLAQRAAQLDLNDAQKAKVNSALLRLNHRTDEIKSYLSRLSTKPLMEQLNGIAALELIIRREGLQGLNEELSQAKAKIFGAGGSFQQGFAQLPSDQKLLALVEAFPHFDSPAELLGHLKSGFPGNYHHEGLAKILAQENGRIRSWNPTLTEIREIADFASFSPETKVALLKAGLASERIGAEELPSLFRASTKDFSNRFQEEVALAVEENFASILQRKPNAATAAAMIQFSSHIPAKQLALGIDALEQANSPEDYLKLSEYLNQRQGIDQQRLKNFLGGDIDHFLRLQPATGQLNRLQALLGGQISLFENAAVRAYLNSRPGFMSAVSSCATWFKKLF